MSCPVCYDDFTQENKMVVCWNEHSLCQGCYSTMMTSARSQNKKCAECRVEMFDWRVQETAPTRRRQRCGVCRQEGHNRLSCRDPRAVALRIQQHQERENQYQERENQRQARLREAEEERLRLDRVRRQRERAEHRTQSIQRFLESTREYIREEFPDSV